VAVTSKPTAKKTTINFSNFAGRGGGSAASKPNRFASIGQAASDNIKQIDNTIALEQSIDSTNQRVQNQQNFLQTLAGRLDGQIAVINERINALQAGQKAIIDNAKDKAKVDEKQRKLEEQKLKRQGAESSLEDDGTKKDIEEKDPKTKKAAKGAMGILDRIKQFFTFVVAGWFTDKTFKLIEAFQTGNKEMITKIGLKLLAGTAAVAGIFSMALFGIGPVLGAIGSLIATLAGLLFNPITLTALLIAVGIGGAVMGIRALWKWGRKKALGGETFRDKHNELDQKLKDAGMDIDGTSKSQSPYQRKHGISARTEEQEKIFQEVQAERKRIKGLKGDMDAEIKAARKEWKANALATKEKGKKVDWAPHNKKWKEIKEGIQKKYAMQVSSPTTTAVGDGSNVGSTASGDTAASNIGPAETGEGNVTVIPKYTEQMDNIQKGKKKGVEPLESGNSDNILTTDAQIQTGMV